VQHGRNSGFHFSLSNVGWRIKLLEYQITRNVFSDNLSIPSFAEKNNNKKPETHPEGTRQVHIRGERCENKFEKKRMGTISPFLSFSKFRRVLLF